MLGRGGRDRFRRDYPSRYEDKSNSVTGRGNSNSNNPPSRHLWVGNLSHSIVEDELAHHFLQFGPLENVAFQPSRSYAFINFKRDEDAIDAMRELQGFPLAGNPLRIEFAKAVTKSHTSMESGLAIKNFSCRTEGTPYIVNDRLSCLLDLIGSRGCAPNYMVSFNKSTTYYLRKWYFLLLSCCFKPLRAFKLPKVLDMDVNYPIPLQVQGKRDALKKWAFCSSQMHQRIA